jgi:hypothetical protein
MSASVKESSKKVKVRVQVVHEIVLSLATLWSWFIASVNDGASIQVSMMAI